jgi:hypothetical protein
VRQSRVVINIVLAAANLYSITAGRRRPFVPAP